MIFVDEFRDAQSGSAQTLSGLPPHAFEFTAKIDGSLDVQAGFLLV